MSKAFWVEKVTLSDDTTCVINELKERYSIEDIKQFTAGVTDAVSLYKSFKCIADDEQLSSDGRKEISKAIDLANQLNEVLSGFNFNTKSGIRNGLIDYGIEHNQGVELCTEYDSVTGRLEEDLIEVAQLLNVGKMRLPDVKRSNPDKKFVSTVVDLFKKHGVRVTSTRAQSFENYKGDGDLHKLCRHLMADAGVKKANLTAVQAVVKSYLKQISD